jgi:hypothetical protein
MAHVLIDGKRYEVVRHFGYDRGLKGYTASVVDDDGYKRTAIKRTGDDRWRFLSELRRWGLVDYF